MKNKAENYNNSVFDEIFNAISPKEEKRIREKMLLAAKIEDAMKAKGWNKTKLLKEIGQKNASVATKWFSGTHNFTFDTLFDLQEILGVKLINTEGSEDEVVNKYHVIVQSNSTASCSNKWDQLFREIEKGDIGFLSQINGFSTQTSNPEA
jgi:ribosome-binding protein aMBF1 (putative translation factor)